MTQPNLRNSLLAALLLTAACGPLVQIGGNAPAPAALLTLTPDPASAGANGPVDLTRAVTVAVPAVPAALQTLRIPVDTAPTQIQYLAKGQWVEQPSRLLDRLLVARLNGAGVAALVPGNLVTGRTLTSQLSQFGLDVRDPARPRVLAVLDVVLTGQAGSVPQARRFEAAVPVQAQTPDEVGRALNTAANQVAGNLAAWIVAHP